MGERKLSDEEKELIEALGGWEKLIETLRQRLRGTEGAPSRRDQMDRHGGTSPFGAYGYNPEGMRIGQDESRNRSAVKVWDQREYRNLDDRSSSGRATSSRACASCVVSRAKGRPKLDLDGTIVDGAQRRAARSEVRSGAAQCG